MLPLFLLSNSIIEVINFTKYSLQIYEIFCYSK